MRYVILTIVLCASFVVSASAQQQPAGEVFLRVEDDGDGIDNEKIFDTQSLGLLGMRERAVALGGNVTVERNFNRGTTLTAHLPIDRNIQAEVFLSRSEPT